MQGDLPEFVTARLRAGREQTGMSVRALARSVRVSPSFISQIENGKANPSVGTLLAIVSALGISLDELFAGVEGDGNRDGPVAPEVGVTAPEPSADALVLRAQDRRRVDLAGGVRWERLTPQTDPVVSFLYVRYDVGGASCPAGTLMQHSGREYGLVLSGHLGAQIGETTYHLEPGDSVATDCTVHHRFWTIGEEPALVVWAIVNRPPGWG